MNKITEVTLISQVTTYSDIGVPTQTPTSTKVIGNLQAVSAQEFFRGGQLGIKPELITVIWAKEYNGEVLAEINGKRYIIYRTYTMNDGRIELYCQKDVGA